MDLTPYQGTDIAPYWRFRPTDFYSDPYTGGSFTGDIMYCSWTCENCVAGETLVHTQGGLVEAAQLEGQSVPTLSDGGVYRMAEWRCFGEQRLWRVTFRNGDEVLATADHEWVVRDAPVVRRGAGAERVRTIDLVGRHVPIICRAAFAYDEESYREGVRHGLVFGDGTLRSNGTAFIHQFGDSMHLVEEFFDRHSHQADSRYSGGRVYAGALPGRLKKDLPSVRAMGESYVRGFIAGLVAADGHVKRSGTVVLHQSDLDTLVAVRRLAAEVGLPSVSLVREREFNPWTGEEAPNYRLTFARAAMADERLILKDSHRESLRAVGPPKRTASMAVVAVEPTDRVEPVYCCIEPETHSWVAGPGYLTGNCWSKFGWHSVAPRHELSADAVAERLWAGCQRNAQSMARLSGGEPMMYWDHVYGVAKGFLERSKGQYLVVPDVTDEDGDPFGLIIETNGATGLTFERLDKLDKDFGKEGGRIVLSIGLKATSAEGLAECNGMALKAAQAAHQRQLDNLMYVVHECENLVPHVSMLDRWTDPAVFAAIQREVERAKRGKGRNCLVFPWKPYRGTTTFYTPKRHREEERVAHEEGEEPEVTQKTATKLEEAAGAIRAQREV